MRKGLVLLGLACLISVAWSQVPWDRSHKQEQADHKRDESQSPTPSIIRAVYVPEGPSKPPQDAKQKPANYPWRELYAPANIPNWCLFVAAVWAGAMALKTLTAIKKQLILQYRPKIIVRFAEASEFNLEDIGKPATAKVRFNIVNSGGSPAHITEGIIALWWTEAPVAIDGKIQICEGSQRQIAKLTVEPGRQHRWEKTLEMNATVDAQWVNYHKGVIAEARRAIVLVGAIYYIDDLKIPRTTGIYRVYDRESMSFIASDSEREYSD